MKVTYLTLILTLTYREFATATRNSPYAEEVCCKTTEVKHIAPYSFSYRFNCLHKGFASHSHLIHI